MAIDPNEIATGDLVLAAPWGGTVTSPLQGQLGVIVARLSEAELLEWNTGAETSETDCWWMTSGHDRSAVRLPDIYVHIKPTAVAAGFADYLS